VAEPSADGLMSGGCKGMVVHDSLPTCVLLADVCTDATAEEIFQYFERKDGTACTNFGDFSETAGATVVTSRVHVDVDYIFKPATNGSVEVTATATAANVRLLDMENGTVLQAARGVSRDEQLLWEAPPEHAMLQLARYGLHAPPSSGLAPWWQMSRDEQLRVYGNQVHILDSLECSSRLVGARVGEFADECRAELLQLLNPALSATERMRRVYAYYAYLCAGKLRRYKKVEGALDRLRNQSFNSSNQSLSTRILGAADEEIEAYTACQDYYTRKLATLPSVLAPAPPSGEGWLPAHGRRARPQ